LALAHVGDAEGHWVLALQAHIAEPPLPPHVSWGDGQAAGVP
jgi:hypothetical protein